MLVGYARVSSVGQSLELQHEQLTKEGCEKIFEEKASGADKDRPQLEAMLDFIRDGDTLVVTKLDRVARSMSHFWEIVERLQANGADIRVLNTPGLDTSSPHGRLLMGILSSVAEFERTLIRERQQEGIERAKRAGKYKGRQPLSETTQREIDALKKQGVQPTEIARQLGIGRATVYKYAKS